VEADPRFSTELQAEFRRLFTRPWDDVLIICTNAALVCAGWALLSENARQWLFSFTGAMAFAVVLESWMLSDTPATNMIANDPSAALAVLPDRSRIGRLVRVKSVALACLIAPPCALVAAGIALYEGSYAAGALLCFALLVMPFGAAAVAASFGTFLPYHPRSLKWRWHHLHPYRHTIRWISLVLAPYAVVPLILLVLFVPAVIVGFAVGGHDSGDHASTAGVAAAVGVVSLFAAVGVWLGPPVCGWLAARRGGTLTDYLNDPERG
jgi:hypothetical protein